MLAVYLFGSRAADGEALLAGREVDRVGSDLDVGVVFRSHEVPLDRLAPLQVALEETFAPLRVDLVPLQRVDALFQFNAASGVRAAAADSTAADLWELEVMRRAADLLPIQRTIERELFGVSTT